MKRNLALLLPFLALAACSDRAESPVAPVQAPASPGKYIVVFHDDGFAGPQLSVSRAISDYAGQSRIAPKFVYTGVLKGFAAELTAEQVERLRSDPRVESVQHDAEVQLYTTQIANLFNWGLDRVDNVDLPLNGGYTYFSTGTGVTAYILDTGINLAHVDFAPAGRAGYIPNGVSGDFVGDGRGNASDCQGHGTHVAGIVGGLYSGVAKNVTIRAGRVVNCFGGGTASMVIAGMDWIRLNGTKPAVVNMSLGYGNVPAITTATQNLVAAGYVVVAAAGNGNSSGTPLDACTSAPGNAASAITVGATDNADAEASFSNYGACVDILAPGVSIQSSNYAVTNQVTSKSGTSMASPHVAGVAAQHLQNNPAHTPAQVTSALLGIAKLNTINLHILSTVNGTPNRFLFTNY